MKTTGRRGYVRAIFSSWSAKALSLSDQTPLFAKVPILLVFYSTVQNRFFLYSMDNNYHATLTINETSSSWYFMLFWSNKTMCCGFNVLCNTHFVLFFTLIFSPCYFLRVIKRWLSCSQVLESKKETRARLHLHD